MQHLWRKAYCIELEGERQLLKLITPVKGRASFQTKLIWRAEKHSYPHFHYDVLVDISNDGKTGVVMVPVPYSVLPADKRLTPVCILNFVDFSTGKKTSLLHNHILTADFFLLTWSPNSHYGVITGDSVAWMIDRFGNTLFSMDESRHFQWHRDSHSVLSVVTPESYRNGQDPVRLVRYQEITITPVGKHTVRNITSQEARHRYGDAYINAVLTYQRNIGHGGLLRVVATTDGQHAVLNGVDVRYSARSFDSISKDDRYMDFIFEGKWHHTRTSRPENAITFSNWSADGRYLYGKYYVEDVVGYDWSKYPSHFRHVLALEVATGQIRTLFTTQRNCGVLLVQ